MWVIGNGESRSIVDIDRLEKPRIGCNAIARDYTVEYLICVDRRMVDESINLKFNDYGIVLTRKNWISKYNKIKNIRVVPDLPYNGEQRWDEPFQWGSGPYAVLLGALKTKTKQVNIIGFDLYSKTKTVNNVYKDTHNYSEGSKRPVDPRYWIHQVGMVFKCFPKIKFTIYQEQGWELPKAWNNTNVEVDNISNIYYNT
jgi:hypothetical protein